MASEDEQAILDAVRMVLGEDGLTRAGTGVFVRHGKLEQALDHTLVPEQTVQFSIKRARIRSIEQDTATVDLEATIVTSTRRNDFESKTTARAQGPGVAVRAQGVSDGAERDRLPGEAAQAGVRRAEEDARRAGERADADVLS